MAPFDGICRWPSSYFLDLLNHQKKREKKPAYEVAEGDQETIGSSEKQL
jgi:hypothetical protein